MKKGVLIYPDSNPKSGLGHVIRCLNLAKFLVKYFDVFLILDNEIYVNKDMLDGIHVLSSKEIFGEISFFKKHNIRFYIYDNYSNKLEYSRKIINVLEDYLNVYHICDSVQDIKYRLSINPSINFIIPNIICENINSLGKDILGKKIYSGKDFVILNDIWSKKISETLIKENNGDIFLKQNFHILFSLGNANLDNSLLWEKKLAHSLRALSNNLNNAKLIVLGQNALDFLDKYKFKYYKFFIKCDLKSLNYIYEISDFYIGSIGYSMWERCAKNLPSFLIPISKNQVDYLKVASKLGIAMELNYNDFNKNSFFKNLNLMKDNCNSLEFTMKGYKELFLEHEK